jgi:hypothetical protein
VARKVSLKTTPKPWAPILEQTLIQVIEERWRYLGYTRELVLKPEPPARQPSRWDVPDQLPGTGMISGYPELDGAVTIIKILRATPWLYRPLRDAVAALGDRKSGPKRMDGCWACAFFGFTDSNEADVQPWYGDEDDQR